MAKLPFDAVFRMYEDGMIEPRQRIRVGGVTFGSGVRLGKGMVMGGVDFTQFIGHELEVETDQDVLVVKAVY